MSFFFTKITQQEEVDEKFLSRENFPPIYIIKRIYPSCLLFLNITFLSLSLSLFLFLFLSFSLFFCVPILLVRANDINKLFWEEVLWYNIQFQFDLAENLFSVKYHSIKRKS